ncbi:hypothetical protein HanIR_Chr15g0754631 [Helianthus annuus]|nr:hypothetical protein HanIR_Chr15g0754631 [Helianthus annuus]
MVYFTQLPIEVVELIIIMLAISSNGVREIANISATCQLFKKITERAHILREVNFHRLTLTENFSMHRHPKTSFACVPKLEIRLPRTFSRRRSYIMTSGSSS